MLPPGARARSASGAPLSAAHALLARAAAFARDVGHGWAAFVDGSSEMLLERIAALQLGVAR
jgi:hypothetical protein